MEKRSIADRHHSEVQPDIPYFVSRAPGEGDGILNGQGTVLIHVGPCRGNVGVPISGVHFDPRLPIEARYVILTVNRMQDGAIVEIVGRPDPVDTEMLVVEGDDIARAELAAIVHDRIFLDEVVNIAGLDVMEGVTGRKSLVDGPGFEHHLRAGARARES